MVSVLTELKEATSSTGKLKVLLQRGRELPPFPKSEQTIENRVMGCTTKTYLTVELIDGERVQFSATSDSELTKGFIWILTQLLQNHTVDEILQFEADDLSEILSMSEIMTPSRTNGFLNLIETLKRKTRMLVRQFPKFPSLVIRSDALEPLGTFAEAQAQYLNPNPKAVQDLAELLRAKKVGVVAHFYMDPEVQGLLTMASEQWPNIAICDSIAMSENALKMVKEGCEHIAVLGVDFMSENVRIVLDRAGLDHIPVYTMSKDHIGCSLAEAADSVAYEDYLKNSMKLSGPKLHVCYINTSMRTKAISQSIVPTISCTSGNVMKTILQGFAQIEDLRILYGPDTYMGRNIRDMFTYIGELTDDEIRSIHPDHNRQTLRSLQERFEFFQEGTCVVHHLFGGEVCKIAREAYGDAYITAHFEVPGEMFTLAMEARHRGMGVVGSSRNILDFITDKVKEQANERTTDQLQFILGTESGMITAITRSVQTIISENPSLKDLEVEIVFPVASSAITTQNQQTEKVVSLPDNMALIPGAASGEGCSAEGGCANCPYMKMNTLTALKQIVERIGEGGLEGFYPQDLDSTIQVNGRQESIHDLGFLPVYEMKHLQENGVLSAELVKSLEETN